MTTCRSTRPNSLGRKAGRFHLNELVRKGLAVVADPHVRYYGIDVKERTLVPEDDAKLGKIRFADWVAQLASKAAAASH